MSDSNRENWCDKLGEGNSLCSLWHFSAHSVLNSEKLNTEVTEDHREPQRKPPFSFRRSISHEQFGQPGSGGV
jgi:hypothetical protein